MAESMTDKKMSDHKPKSGIKALEKMKADRDSLERLAGRYQYEMNKYKSALESILFNAGGRDENGTVLVRFTQEFIQKLRNILK